MRRPGEVRQQPGGRTGFRDQVTIVSRSALTARLRRQSHPLFCPRRTFPAQTNRNCGAHGLKYSIRPPALPFKVPPASVGAKLESHSAAEISAPDGYRERIAVVIDGSEYAIEVAVRAEGAALDLRKESGKQAKEQALAKVAGSRTISTLLGVQLPVSISFGNTRMPLKDVLKLTTGTVVELNRQPEDPVDIIVNDCVIARGEVVVVDGNYAVRIQSIIARQDRIGLGFDETDGSTIR